MVSLYDYLFVGVTMPATPEAFLGVTIYGADVVYASALPLGYIIILGAVAQGTTNQVRANNTQWQVSLPLSVLAVVINVYFVNSVILLALVTDAVNR